jgi:hypothetical protein
MLEQEKQTEKADRICWSKKLVSFNPCIMIINASSYRAYYHNAGTKLQQVG